MNNSKWNSKKNDIYFYSIFTYFQYLLIHDSALLMFQFHVKTACALSPHPLWYPKTYLVTPLHLWTVASRRLLFNDVLQFHWSSHLQDVTEQFLPSRSLFQWKLVNKIEMWRFLRFIYPIELGPFLRPDRARKPGSAVFGHVFFIKL